MTLTEYYNHIYRLSYITRYSNLPRIKDEDVAQHSFFVAAIVIKLSEKYTFDLTSAIAIAVCHDIVEADTNDITNDIKIKHPGFASELEIVELKELGKYPRPIETYAIEYMHQRTVESKIVKLADILQVQQYLSNEIDLGNSIIKDMWSKVNRRRWEIKKELKEYERTDKETN